MIAPAKFSTATKTVPPKAARATRLVLSRQEALHDAGLVRRVNAGDSSAFTEIVTRYRERMFTIAFRLLKNRADAEEIAQDTFIRAYRGLAKFRGDASLATWLHRIAVNLSRNRYWYFFRRQRHATQSFDCAFNSDSPATLADLVATDVAGPARAAATNEFSGLVTICMEKLGQPAREILTLLNSRNLSYGEISRELGINIGTVKSRVARARQSLHKLFTEACPEFAPDSRPASWFEPIRPAGGLAVVCAA